MDVVMTMLGGIIFAAIAWVTVNQVQKYIRKRAQKKIDQYLKD